MLDVRRSDFSSELHQSKERRASLWHGLPPATTEDDGRAELGALAVAGLLRESMQTAPATGRESVHTVGNVGLLRLSLLSSHKFKQALSIEQRPPFGEFFDQVARIP